MAVVSLRILAEALECNMAGWDQYLNVAAGEVAQVSESPWVIGKEEYEEMNAKVEESEDYINLPTQYELREYPIMKKFAYEYPSEIISEKLLGELNRSKPYRHFKDTINNLGIEDRYYEFRAKAYLEIAREWCEYRGVEYED